jgi:acyl-CoA synthetase (AMP-forming)/AMP-acid ligase II
MTYRELDTLSASAAGCKRRDLRCAGMIMLPNIPQFMPDHGGTLRAGGGYVCVNVNPPLTPRVGQLRWDSVQHQLILENFANVLRNG